jgi:hypothetical protein
MLPSLPAVTRRRWFLSKETAVTFELPWPPVNLPARPPSCDGDGGGGVGGGGGKGDSQ